jgi:PKD repeat protein
VASLGGGPSGDPPRAVLEFDVATANAPAWVNFSGARSTDDGGPLRWFLWDFGDGTRSVGPTARHVYPQDGTYTVSLLVRDGSALDAVDQRTIRVHSVGAGPLARLSASALQIRRGERIVFDSAGSLDPDGGPLFVHWDFGDPASGENNQSAQSLTSHVFPRTGAYLVWLSVTDDEGSTATSTALVRVR